ncbi:MAG: extensin family protein, partial [Pseudomonadota bacterium]
MMDRVGSSGGMGALIVAAILLTPILPVGITAAQAQSLGQIIDSFAGSLGQTRSRRTRENRPRQVVIPPLPTKQPKPWHAQTFVKTQPHPSTGPEPEWPRVLPKPAQNTAAIKQAQRSQVVTNPSASPQRPPVASPLRQKSTNGPADSSKLANGRATQTNTIATVEPDIYTQVQIRDAQARCRRLLETVKAEVRPEAPIKKGPCGDAAPVKLISLGSKPRVAVVPPAIVNCDMVVALHGWLTDDLQPLANKHLKSPIVKLENMSSYSCRNAYGRKNGRLSEHGKANALDIRGFVTKAGKPARLLAHWGPTGRDIKAYRLAQQKAEEAKKAAIAKANEPGAKQEVATDTAPPPSPPIRRATLVDGVGPSLGGNSANSSAPSLSLGPNRLGGPVPVPSRTQVSGKKSNDTVVRV